MASAQEAHELKFQLEFSKENPELMNRKNHMITGVRRNLDQGVWLRIMSKILFPPNLKGLRLAPW